MFVRLNILVRRIDWNFSPTFFDPIWPSNFNFVCTPQRANQKIQKKSNKKKQKNNTRGEARELDFSSASTMSIIVVSLVIRVRAQRRSLLISEPIQRADTKSNEKSNKKPSKLPNWTKKLSKSHKHWEYYIVVLLVNSCLSTGNWNGFGYYNEYTQVVLVS